ncbi:hypothetical protein ScPMuIL_013944 [Solemya velum]
MIEACLFDLLEGFVAIWLYTGGYNIVVSGDDISKVYNEKAVLVLNHQSTADVPVVMAAASSMPRVAGNIMWIMDYIFKYTNFGICSHFHGDFFISQGKDKSEQLQKLTKHMKTVFIAAQKKWIVLFPEGGFLRKRKEGSKRFAKKNNLPELENVTIPRVGAFEVVLKSLKQNTQNGKVSDLKSSQEIKWVVDVTIAYPGGNPLDLHGIGFGYWPPCVIHTHYRIYPVSEIPLETEKLSNWLYERFIEKEHLLQQYYTEDKFLDETDTQKRVLPQMPRKQLQQRVIPISEEVLYHYFSNEVLEC